MKHIKIVMSEDDLLNIWSMCKLEIESNPDYHDENDKRLVEELSQMYYSLKEHTCKEHN